MATKEAAEILSTEDTYIKLFSDSQAALKSINNHKITSRTVDKAVDALNQLGLHRHRLELNWIKAQYNYVRNERADELARNAVYINIVYFNHPYPTSGHKFKSK